MDRRFYRSVLSVAITAILFPGVAMGNCLSQYCASDATDDTITWTWSDKEQSFNDTLIEKSGNGINKMVVKDFNIENFHQNAEGVYGKLYVKSAISLGGGNGQYPSSQPNQFYGDLHLSVLDSTVKGSIDSWRWTGLYVRSDSEKAVVTAQSNSTIDMTAQRTDGGWIEGAAVYAETKGEGGQTQVLLDTNSDITVTMEATATMAEANAGVLAYAENGTTYVKAEKDTSITTNGFGVTGIKTYSRDGSYVSHNGTLTSNSDSGRGIHSHGTAINDGKGNLVIRNEADGIITMHGINSMAIKAYNEANGNIAISNAGSIVLNQGKGSSEADKDEISSGMYMQTNTVAGMSAGDIEMSALNTGTITTFGENSEAIRSESNIDSGLVALENQGSINVNGKSSTGIMARSSQRNDEDSTTKLQVVNSGTITLGENAADSTGIYVDNSATLGDVLIVNKGKMTATGSSSSAISAIATHTAQVSNEGEIVTADGSGIVVESREHDALVINSGNISVGSLSDGLRYGIHAISNAGTAAVQYAKGKLSVTGHSIGIAASGSGSQQILLDEGTHVDASQGLGGVQISGRGEGHIVIAKEATVTGGSANGFGAKYSGLGSRDSSSSQFTLDNAGTLGALSDLAFVAENAADSQIALNNYGDITGYLRADGGNISLTNHNTLNLRSFADTDGDQVRDTKQVAMMQFGTGENSVKNEAGALIQLAEVNGESSVDTAGQFSSQGGKSITTEGITQGQMLGVKQFNNAGTLNLAANQLAGDILAITNNNSLAGQSVHDSGSITSGGGQFTSDGGMLLLDTVLNEGGNASQSDVLVVDNASKGSGATTIVINQVGGNGALTQQDGIQVVNVLGDASKDAFTLAGGPLKAGAYEYTLEQGSLSNPANQSFYLRTDGQQINPDVGSYLANQTMATGLFMHSLHDRLGEPQYTQRYKGDERTVPGLWLRGVASNTKMDAAGRSLSQDINSRVIHLGGDLARWDNDNGDRYHLGIMGAYGRADTESRGKKTGSHSRSKVDGYGVGAYLTWYNKAEQQEGWYADLWGMYNWFENTADSAKDYDSESWVVSLESGHASTVKPFEQWRWMIEPQAQVSYAHYSADNITDKNGMKVGNDDANGVSTRLGVRTYLQPTAPNDKAKFQPFLTVNWLWTDADNSMDFNGSTFSSDLPKNRFEAKLGLQTEVRQDLHIYGQISGQVGENNYSHKAAQLGLRYNF